jgi:hypothetical protein
MENCGLGSLFLHPCAKSAKSALSFHLHATSATFERNATFERQRQRQCLIVTDGCIYRRDGCVYNDGCVYRRDEMGV